MLDRAIGQSDLHRLEHGNKLPHRQTRRSNHFKTQRMFSQFIEPTDLESPQIVPAVRCTVGEITFVQFVQGQVQIFRKSTFRNPNAHSARRGDQSAFLPHRGSIECGDFYQEGRLHREPTVDHCDYHLARCHGGEQPIRGNRSHRIIRDNVVSPSGGITNFHYSFYDSLPNQELPGFGGLKCVAPRIDLDIALVLGTHGDRSGGLETEGLDLHHRKSVRDSENSPVIRHHGDTGVEAKERDRLRRQSESYAAGKGRRKLKRNTSSYLDYRIQRIHRDPSYHRLRHLDRHRPNPTVRQPIRSHELETRRSHEAGMGKENRAPTVATEPDGSVGRIAHGEEERIALGVGREVGQVHRHREVLDAVDGGVGDGRSLVDGEAEVGLEEGGVGGIHRAVSIHVVRQQGEVGSIHRAVPVEISGQEEFEVVGTAR